MSEHTSFWDLSSKILLPVFFNNSSNVTVAKPIHTAHQCILYTKTEFLQLCLTYCKTSWLHCVPSHVLLTLLWLCEYMHTCAHPIQLNCCWISNDYKLDPCVYEISDLRATLGIRSCNVDRKCWDTLCKEMMLKKSESWIFTVWLHDITPSALSASWYGSPITIFILLSIRHAIVLWLDTGFLLLSFRLSPRWLW